MINKKQKNIIHFIELGAFFIIWGLVFISPAILQRNSGEVNWAQILGNWKRLFPFLLLSLINHFVLVPYFFFMGRKIWYLLSVVAVIILFSATLRMINPLRMEPPENKREMLGPPPNQRFGPPHPPHRPRPVQPLSALPPMFNTALIALLIIGFDTGLRTVFRLSQSEQEKNQLAKEQVESKLAFLRNQINPHFLMNTLNNIHALIEMDTELAQETVIRLSDLMRYLLYDTERDLIPLKEELNFVKSYVELMKMRIIKRVDVKLNIDVVDDQKQIPPLLFTSLIENAFKYGVSHKMDTFVHIDFKTSSNELIFDLKNSIVHRNNGNTSYSGIGLENTKHRLDILFGNNYTLDISENEKIFSVKLIIPL